MEIREQSSTKLPDRLSTLFWEYDFETLTWEHDRDLIMGRILTSGDWAAVTWLRAYVGDQALRAWLERYRGGGLSPVRLRFWELILDLPARQVNAWLNTAGRKIWQERVYP